jgi:hypothetical protein
MGQSFIGGDMRGKCELKDDERRDPALFFNPPAIGNHTYGSGQTCWAECSRYRILNGEGRPVIDFSIKAEGKGALTRRSFLL